MSASGIIEDSYMTESRSQSFHGTQNTNEVPQLNQHVIFTEWHVYKYSYIIYAFFYTIYHALSFSLELLFPGVPYRLSFFCVPFEHEAFINFSGKGHEGAEIIIHYRVCSITLPKTKSSHLKNGG